MAVLGTTVMKRIGFLLVSLALLSILGGCGANDVTNNSYEDAMKERGEKAKKLTDKEGTTVPDSSSAISQDPQAGASSTPSADPNAKPKDGGN